MAGGSHSIIPVAALTDEAVTPGLYRMLGALAGKTGPDGTVEVSSYRLALMLGVTRQSVSEAVVTLGKLGYVSIEGGGQGKRAIVRVIHSPQVPADRMRVVPDGSEMEAVSQNRNMRVAPDGSKGSASDYLTVPSTKPSGEPKSENVAESETVRREPHVPTPAATPAPARDNGLSLRESQSTTASTHAAAASNQQPGSSMPARNGSAAAAAAGKATFGSIGDTSRVTAERIATTLYSAAGVEWGELSEAIRRREIVIAHELAVKGASPAEAAAFVAWCQAGEHRPNVTSMRTYENHRATFRMKSAAVSHSTAGDGSDLGNGRAIG